MDDNMLQKVLKTIDELKHKKQSCINTINFNIVPQIKTIIETLSIMSHNNCYSQGSNPNHIISNVLLDEIKIKIIDKDNSEFAYHKRNNTYLKLYINQKYQNASFEFKELEMDKPISLCNEIKLLKDLINNFIIFKDNFISHIDKFYKQAQEVLNN